MFYLFCVLIRRYILRLLSLRTESLPPSQVVSQLLLKGEYLCIQLLFTGRPVMVSHCTWRKTQTRFLWSRERCNSTRYVVWTKDIESQVQSTVLVRSSVKTSGRGFPCGTGSHDERSFLRCQFFYCDYYKKSYKTHCPWHYPPNDYKRVTKKRRKDTLSMIIEVKHTFFWLNYLKGFIYRLWHVFKSRKRNFLDVVSDSKLPIFTDPNLFTGVRTTTLKKEPI